jgi:CRISPR-associated protein Cas1
MIKRTLYFSNPCYLSKKQYQLIVDYDDDDSNRKQVPIEDIGIMVIDHAQIKFSSALMQALIEQNAAIIFTDQKHMPSGLLLPFAEHHAFTEKMYYQIEASQPLKKKLWQQTVMAKIRNQANLLESHVIDTENMRYWTKHVKSGDPDNLEGRAAAYYWNNIFIEINHFRRARYGDAPNNLLNYGYAVLRAIVARSLVGSGLFPAIGIHHRNKYNPYCLADDIIEPYRPYFDELVIDIMNEEPDIDELTLVDFLVFRSLIFYTCCCQLF